MVLGFNSEMATKSIFILVILTYCSLCSEAQQNKPGLWTNTNWWQNAVGQKVLVGGSASSGFQTASRGVWHAKQSSGSDNGTAATTIQPVTPLHNVTEPANPTPTDIQPNVTSTVPSVTVTGNTTAVIVAGNTTVPSVTGADNTTAAAASTTTQVDVTSTTATNATTAQSVTTEESTEKPLVGGGPVQTGVTYPPIVEGGAPSAQVPGVWQALDGLRGKPGLTAEEIQAILATAQPNMDYPAYDYIPDQINFSCAKVKQAGFYADLDFGCQVFRRCDIYGIETSYLCPNQTEFNQITLTCDWFFNVDCPNSAQYSDYSNSRLYHSTWYLLDTPGEAVDNTTTTAAPGPVANSTTTVAPGPVAGRQNLGAKQANTAINTGKIVIQRQKTWTGN